MITVLFLVSFVCLVMFVVAIVGLVLGNKVITPVPVLHLWGAEFSNSYLGTPAMAYQAYFWFNYYGVLA